MTCSVKNRTCFSLLVAFCIICCRLLCQFSSILSVLCFTIVNLLLLHILQSDWCCKLFYNRDYANQTAVNNTEALRWGIAESWVFCPGQHHGLAGVANSPSCLCCCSQRTKLLQRPRGQVKAHLHTHLLCQLRCVAGCSGFREAITLMTSLCPTNSSTTVYFSAANPSFCSMQ